MKQKIAETELEKEQIHKNQRKKWNYTPGIGI
jgi:hypothetical protein